MAVEMDENLDLQQQMDDAIYYHYDIEPKNEEGAQKIPQSGIRWYKRVAAGLGILCAILVLLNIAVPLSLYHSNMVERDRVITSYNQLIEERDQLKNKCNNLTRRVCVADGFTFGDGLCYYISTESKTWERSRQWCRERQSDLMVIKTKEKEDFVERVFVARDKNLWLGLKDKDRGSFQWVDGTPLTTPTYWIRGQPNHSGQCVKYNVNDRGWNDVTCPTSMQWICERAMC